MKCCWTTLVRYYLLQDKGQLDSMKPIIHAVLYMVAQKSKPLPNYQKNW